MKQVINTEKFPIKVWLDDIEDGAMNQAKNLANLPFIYRHVALMPDCHQGYGMPIGGVIAAKDVIIPNAVGKDISCGVIAIKTSLNEIKIDLLKQIMGIIRRKIPVGFSHHKENQHWAGFRYAPMDIEIISEQLPSAMKQIGTLGGGNHFIEFQKDKDDYIWVMIHSGSRGFGYKIASHYNKIATDLCKSWYSNIPECKGEDSLAFLPLSSCEGEEYKEAMNFSIQFAEASRKMMMYRISDIIKNCLRKYEDINVSFDEPIDVNHNYASIENHFGKNVWIHRKGATSARLDQIGIIPGSQGTKSYIVKGKGNQESFMSCSHGAGRKMSRTKAKNELNLQNEIEKLDKQGIIHGIRTKNELDEASGAYKDIDEVMKNQTDLVDIEVELTPLAVIKG